MQQHLDWAALWSNKHLHKVQQDARSAACQWLPAERCRCLQASASKSSSAECGIHRGVGCSKERSSIQKVEHPCPGARPSQHPPVDAPPACWSTLRTPPPCACTLVQYPAQAQHRSGIPFTTCCNPSQCAAIVQQCYHSKSFAIVHYLSQCAAILQQC